MVLGKAGVCRPPLRRWRTRRRRRTGQRPDTDRYGCWGLTTSGASAGARRFPAGRPLGRLCMLARALGRRSAVQLLQQFLRRDHAVALDDEVLELGPIDLRAQFHADPAVLADVSGDREARI